MAKHGIKGIIGGGVAEGGAMNRVIQAYRDSNARAGRDLEMGENLSIGFHFYIADTQEAAVAVAAKFYEENLKMFGPLRLVRDLSDEQIDAMSDPSRAPTADLPRIDNAVRTGGFLAGPPDLIIEQLHNIEDAYPGMERVSVSQPVGTPQSVIIEQMEQFAEEVMPDFAGRTAELVPAD